MLIENLLDLPHESCEAVDNNTEPAGRAHHNKNFFFFLLIILHLPYNEGAKQASACHEAKKNDSEPFFFRPSNDNP